MAEAEDRTEAPTAKKRQEARAAGQVALSREVMMLSGLAAGVALLHWTGGSLAATLTASLRPLLAGRLDVPSALALAGRALAAAALPVALVVCAGSLATGLLQTGFLVRTAALRPDLARLNPVRGLGRVFGRQNLTEAGKAVAKLAVLGWAAWWGVRDSLPVLAATSLVAPQALAAAVAGAAWRVALPVLGAHAAIAGLDLLLVRRKQARQLRMSREDVRQETRESDGDPRMKARLRRLRMTRARTRMMAKVPTATVVVTNPTHYAVALAFDRAKQGAPRLVAKGADEVAARIREMARAHGVPLVANPPLARALFRMELETEIPAEHFQAVAEIIAYVWRLRGRVAG